MSLHFSIARKYEATPISPEATPISPPKAWIENRLEELAKIFAVAVGGFSVLDNHLHLLVRLDPDIASDGRTRM